MKQNDLKEILKLHNLRLSGNKSILILRINCHLYKNKKIVTIQKVVRGFFVRLFFKLRAVGFKKEILSDFNLVNDTDYHSMDPLNEISFYNLFVYVDDKNFAYGFNIQSLVTSYFILGRINNPYNRDKFPFKTISNILSLYGMIKIIFNIRIETPIIVHKIPSTHYIRQLNYRTGHYSDDLVTRSSSTITTNRNTHRNLSIEIINNQELITRREFLREISNRQINTRIEELFIEIDLLGNYTLSSWFTSLTISSLRTFYMNLRDIWYYKARLLPSVKILLYPFGELYTDIFDLQTLQNFTRDEMKRFCTSIVENLVFSALDRENRILGTNLFLMALTSVSSDARRQYFWLYETIMW